MVDGVSFGYGDMETDVMRYVLLALVALLVAGCGEQRFDATSEETVKASIEQMGKNLSQEDKVRFARGIMGSAIGPAFQAAMTKDSAHSGDLTKSLHGLTAKQIMERGDAMLKRFQKASESPPATGPRE